MNLDLSQVVRDWIKSQWLNFRRALTEPQGTEELLCGAYIGFYKPGTTESAAIFADEALLTVHPNPVVADSRGEFPPIFVENPDEQIAMRLFNMRGEIIMSAEDARPFFGNRCLHCGQRLTLNTGESQ